MILLIILILLPVMRARCGWLDHPAFHFDFPLHCVNDAVDFVPAQCGKMALGWEGEEGLDYDFALADQVD
jgi:hypothetical protein